MILQVGVKALLKNGDGKYLVVKRSVEKYVDVEESWDIPGGRIDPDKPLFENLKREVMEETSLDLIKIPRLLCAQDIFAKDGERHIVRLTYVGEIEGQPTLDEENTDYQWLSLEELRNLDKIDPFLKEALDLM